MIINDGKKCPFQFKFKCCVGYGILHGMWFGKIFQTRWNVGMFYFRKLPQKSIAISETWFMRFCENPKQIKKRKITTHGFCPLDLWYVQVLRTTNARNWLQKIIDTGRRKRVKFYFFPLCKQMQILRETRKETNDNNKNEKKNKRAREKKAKKYCAMFTCFVVVACSNMSTILNLWPFGIVRI